MAETMIETVAKAMTTTLRHHGVEMHPDDVKGLAHDAITALRRPSLAMMEAANRHANTLMPNPAVFLQRVLDAALEEG